MWFPVVSIHFHSSESRPFHKARSGTYSGVSASCLAPTVTTSGTHNGDLGCQKGVRKGSNRALKPVFRKLLENVVSICYLLCFSHVGHLEKLEFLLSFGVANWTASAGQETHVSKTHFGGSGGDLAASRVISKPHLGFFWSQDPPKRGLGMSACTLQVQKWP